MGNILTGLSVSGIVAVFIVALIIWPWAIVWAINTLFGLGIAYTFKTWLACAIIMLVFGKSTVKVGK